LKASAALRRLQTVCGQFTSEDHATYAGQQLLNSSDQGSDILAAARRAFVESWGDSMTEHKASVRTLLELQDPLLLNDVGMRLSLYDGPDGAYLYFDGEKHLIRDNPSLIAAYYLLPCGMGLKCDSSEMELAMRCVVGTGCYSSRFDVVREEMSGGSAQKYQEILATYRAMLSAVQAGEVHRFVP
jgi:hypothetical protein